MKHISKLRHVNHQCDCGVKSTSEKFHPLSYYLNGGIDLTGEALDKTGEVEYDTEEQAEEIIAEGASSVSLGDPRMSKFRLVEQLGAKAAAAAANAKSSAAGAGDVGKGESGE